MPFSSFFFKDLSFWPCLALISKSWLFFRASLICLNLYFSFYSLCLRFICFAGLWSGLYWCCCYYSIRAFYIIFDKERLVDWLLFLISVIILVVVVISKDIILFFQILVLLFLPHLILLQNCLHDIFYLK